MDGSTAPKTNGANAQDHAGDQAGPKLFGALPQGLFGIFHRGSRTEYARLVLELWRRFYADPLQEHPYVKDVTRFLDEQLRNARDKSDGTSGTDTPGHNVYYNLVDAGWLTPYPDGYRTLVEMPEAVSRLVRFLSELERGAATSLGGAVASMLSALRAASDNPEANALAVRDTAHRAEDFLWRLRALVTGLRRLEASMLEQRDPGEILGQFFGRFVAVVVSDWHTLKTAHNPYRYRGAIVGLAADLLDDENKLRRLGLAYKEQELATSVAEATAMVADDLHRTRDALLGLDGLTERIDLVKRRVERRVAITVSYLELAGSDATVRLSGLIRRLADDATSGQHIPMATMAQPPGRLCPAVLAGARPPRERVASMPAQREPPDPRLAGFVAARHAFLERVRVGNRMLTDFAERQLQAGGAITAARINLRSLEDVVAFCAMPSVAQRRAAWPSFRVEALPGRAVTESVEGGIDGPDFLIWATGANRSAPDAE